MSKRMKGLTLAGNNLASCRSSRNTGDVVLSVVYFFFSSYSLFKIWLLFIQNLGPKGTKWQSIRSPHRDN